MNVSAIVALVIDVLTISLIAGIAPNYHWFWSTLLEMTEPFTHWFARIAKHHPLFWWGGVFTFAVVSIMTALFAPWYWRITGLVFTGFFSWFIPHIWQAEAAQLRPNEHNILSPVGAIEILFHNVKCMITKRC